MEVATTCGQGLVGRVLAHDVELSERTLYEGSILSEADVEAVCKEFDTIKVQGGIIAKKVALNAENVASVLNYGQRMYALGRLTDEEGNDIVDADGDLYVDGYTPRVKPDALDPDTDVYKRQIQMFSSISWITRNIH